MSDDPLRGTGRTTRLAVNYLKECLDKPGEWVEIKDHYELEYAHRWLAVTVSAFLEIMHVPYQKDGPRIRVVPIGEKR